MLLGIFILVFAQLLDSVKILVNLNQDLRYHVLGFQVALFELDHWHNGNALYFSGVLLYCEC